MKSHVATEQLLVSDAIERAVDQLDFQPVANSNVYLDTQYMDKVVSQGFLNSDYIRSALRQRLMASNCRLSESAADAEYVVEVRVGALGTDAHEINYGIPASNPISSTASIISGSVGIPTVPEISLAKKDERRGAAEIHLFAYRRETMEPVWQPEVSHGRSSARSTWVFGAGPFQKGTIYRRTRFAGAPIEELEVNQLPAIADLRDGIQERPLFLSSVLPFGPGLLAGLFPDWAKKSESVSSDGATNDAVTKDAVTNDAVTKSKSANPDIGSSNPAGTDSPGKSIAKRIPQPIPTFSVSPNAIVTTNDTIPAENPMQNAPTALTEEQKNATKLVQHTEDVANTVSSEN